MSEFLIVVKDTSDGLSTVWRVACKHTAEIGHANLNLLFSYQREERCASDVMHALWNRELEYEDIEHVEQVHDWTPVYVVEED